MPLTTIPALLPVLLGAASGFSFAHDNGRLTLSENGDPVFVFHTGVVEPPAPLPAALRRSAYIHPLYGLDGETLTQDFPLDHLHHRGIFWAWPEVRLNGERIDLWHLRGVRTRHVEIIEETADARRARLAVRNIWSQDDSPGEAIVTETVRILVHPADESGRAIDFDLAFENTSGNAITFAGASGKGYGGFNLRPDAVRKPFSFTAASGPLDEDHLRYPTPWADVSFQPAPDGPHAGAAIFQHPGNPGYPHEGWIMRHYGFLGACWPHEEEFELGAGDTLRLRYRVYVHRGNAAEGKVPEAFERWLEDAAAE